MSFPGSEPMDRETQDKFVLIIEAYDNYHFGFTTGDSRHSFAQVVISVTDVNDQVPVFEVEEQNNSPHNCAIINEFHAIGKRNMPLKNRIRSLYILAVLDVFHVKTSQYRIEYDPD